MTFIQPHKNSGPLNLILGGLVAVVILGVFGMIALYNNTVNLDHNITSMKTELDAVGAKSTALNNEIVSTMNSADLAALASRDGLVVESKPQYFPITQSEHPTQWGIASQ